MSVCAEDHFLFDIGQTVELFEPLDIFLLTVPRAVGREKYLFNAVILYHSYDILVCRLTERADIAERTADVDIAVLSDKIPFNVMQ